MTKRCEQNEKEKKRREREEKRSRWLEDVNGKSDEQNENEKCLPVDDNKKK